MHDQALPLPYNLGASAFNTTNFFDANGTLSEQPWILRKHQPFRPVSDAALFYGNIPTEFTNTRLIGRSVWNSAPTRTPATDDSLPQDCFGRCRGGFGLRLLRRLPVKPLAVRCRSSQAGRQAAPTWAATWTPPSHP